MNEWHLLILAGLFLSCRSEMFSTTQSVCQFVKEFGGQHNVAFRSTSVESNETVSTISAFEVFDHSSVPPKVEITRTITECEGKDVVHFEAVIRGSKAPTHVAHEKPRTEKLRFYERGGKNAVVSADGNTVTRNNELENEGHAGILTNRPLNDDELFEVKLDKSILNYDDTLGIGVTYHDPTSIDYPKWMSCGTIILYDHRVYEHGGVVRNVYGANLKKMRVGDRVGVMKKRNGDLHFLINGEDQGIAKSNVTYPVYGVVDVYGSAIQLSIVSH